MNDFIIIIPARLNSSRLKHKMLADIQGIPLVIRTAQQALKSNAKQVIVATDSILISDICKQYSVDSVLTNKNHQSGTERITEVVKLLNIDDNMLVVNVQGDEPLIDENIINELAYLTYQNNAKVSTVAHKISNLDDLNNKNIVKVIVDINSNALYFSRASIPYNRDISNNKDSLLINSFDYLHHIGIYAYKSDFLKKYSMLPKSKLEEIEKLEQLKILYNGYKIFVMVTKKKLMHGVDDADDLNKIRDYLCK